MRLEITHTVNATKFADFIQAYKEALTANSPHNEPRILVSLFGEINRIRIEFEFEQDDMPFQSWLERGCPSIIEEEPKIDQFAKMYNLSERVEVALLRDVDVSN